NSLVAQRLGWETLGWKIAGTTAAVRAKLRLGTPIYGRTFRRFACESPAHLRAGELLDPLVECEFFVTLATGLPARPAPIGCAAAFARDPGGWQRLRPLRLRRSDPALEGWPCRRAGDARACSVQVEAPDRLYVFV